MPYKVFIVEDDTGIATGIENCLSKWDMTVKTAVDFKNVLEEFSEFAPHLVLMDVTLPFMNGYHYCSEIRKISNVPIIFISSACDNMNIVMAMNIGADDFISKPFDSSVLVAKVQAVLRRTYDLSSSPVTLEYKGVKLNTGDYSVSFGDKSCELSKNEYRILFSLMKNAGKTVSREKLMEELWETDCFVDENTLSVNVGRLRKKLESLGLESFVSTKFGMGYIIP